jgi:hypothetical protein
MRPGVSSIFALISVAHSKRKRSDMISSAEPDWMSEVDDAGKADVARGGEAGGGGKRAGLGAEPRDLLFSPFLGESYRLRAARGSYEEDRVGEARKERRVEGKTRRGRATRAPSDISNLAGRHRHIITEQEIIQMQHRLPGVDEERD